MSLVPILDSILFNAQRQGRISFYMQAAGEEASVVGSATALEAGDEIFGQYVRSLRTCADSSVNPPLFSTVATL